MAGRSWLAVAQRGGAARPYRFVGPARAFQRNLDIEYAKKQGRRISTAFFNMVICQSDVSGSRVGIVVGKRFGGAVSRNRVKRLYRELTRQLRGHLLPGYDLVVFPKRDSIVQPFASLKEVWLVGPRAPTR